MDGQRFTDDESTADYLSPANYINSMDHQNLSSGTKVPHYEYMIEEHEIQPEQNAHMHDTSSASPVGWWWNMPNPVEYIWRETVDDLRRIGWHRIVDLTYNHALPNLCIGVLLIILVFLTVMKPVNQSQHLCRPDGSPAEGGSSQWKKSDPWDTSQTFTINMGFGELSFGQAKLIDVIWDTVSYLPLPHRLQFVLTSKTFGHGGQTLMALISYRVLTSAVSLLMEQGSVTTRTFEAITLDGSTVVSVAKLVRDMSKNNNVRCRVIISASILSVMLVLIFPTLASAMTGYSANFNAQVTVSNGTTIPATSLQRVWYIIHDGSRLGEGFHDEYPIADYTSTELSFDSYTSQYLVTARAFEKSRPDWLPGCSAFAPGQVGKDGNVITLRQNNTASPPECQHLWDMSLYTNTYGFLGRSNDNSSFYNSFEQKMVSLSPPVLNVTVHMAAYFSSEQPRLETLFRTSSLAWSIVPFGVTWYEENQPASFSFNIPMGDLIKPLLYTYRGFGNASEIMTREEIVQDLKCHQQSPGSDRVIEYRWGFAFILLVVFTALLLVWSIILYAIHIHVRRHSQLMQQHRTVGLKRAVLDLAPIYQECLDQGDLMCSETHIEKLVHTTRISYEGLVRSHPVTSSSQREHKWHKMSNIHQWIKSEWICILLLSVIVVLLPLGVHTLTIIAVDPRYAPLLIVGLISMLMVGKEHFSRWLLFLPFLAAFLGLQTWYALFYFDIYGRVPKPLFH